MPLSNITCWPNIKLSLYNGNNQSAIQSDNSASSLSNQKDSVKISDEAKSLLHLQSDTENSQLSLKSRINALFKEARDDGSFITFDSSKGGEWLDLSSFTDDELAQIAKDKNSEFSDDLSKYAVGTLAQRVQLSLEPFEAAIGYGNFRGEAKAVRALYNHMSQDVRDVMGWTETMVEGIEKIAQKSTQKPHYFDMDSIWVFLLKSSQKANLSFQKIDH